MKLVGGTSQLAIQRGKRQSAALGKLKISGIVKCEIVFFGKP